MKQYIKNFSDFLLEYSKEGYERAEEKARQYGMEDLANKFKDAKENSEIFGRAVKNNISFEFKNIPVEVKFITGIVDTQFCDFATQISEYDGSSKESLSKMNTICITFDSKDYKDIFMYPIGMGESKKPYCFICQKNISDYRTIQDVKSFKDRLEKICKRPLTRKDAQELINSIVDASGIESMKGLSWRWFVK